ncbi:glycosyltransferase family 87 protein [Halobacterium zhouii]|uniref:glycosyltransferase family 87 protein n=1 Tax=Halobacterium zhouii TaxID=2902624 RepID=UPI001E4697F9|nr:glycosyltransferase family 87 protein [Halobacterium zhouii]
MASHRGPRLVLAVGVLAGVLTGVSLPVVHPEQVALASDHYYRGARAALLNADIYAGNVGFLYPPPVVVAFYPLALLGDPAGAFALQVALDLVALAVLAALLVAVTERAGVDLSRVDRVLVAGYALASLPVVANLLMGQVNPVLALAIAGGAVLLERNRPRASGVAFGLAALVKLFPALVGVWLLRRRAWTAIAAATATGVGLLAVGALAFGVPAYEAYITHTLTGEMAVGAFQHGPDPTAPYVTVRRQLGVLAPWLPGWAVLPASLLAVAPVLVGVNRTVDTLRSRLVALQGTLLATLVAFPLEGFYVALTVFPLVPLLYLLDSGVPRRLFLAGALLLSVPVTYDTVAVATAASVVPLGVGAAVREAARSLFAFALPSMVGVWLVLAACLLVQHRAATVTHSPEDAARSGPPNDAV